MLHFVTPYMKQNKSRKQTLESAQYGLEISFNFVGSQSHRRSASQRAFSQKGSTRFWERNVVRN